MKRSIVLLLILLLPGAPLLANQDGLVVRNATLHAGAGRDAAVVGRIDAGTRVAIFDRKGGWREIYSEEKALVGWVRIYEVRELDSAVPAAIETQSDSRGFLSGLASFSRKASRFFGAGGATTSSSTATIGVRGLSEAELRGAQPDLQELERMRGYASSSTRSAEFGENGALRARQIKHLKPRADSDRISDYGSKK